MNSGLELQGVSRLYGNKKALDDVSFQVSKGRVCGFLGPNGAGKTTAMRAIFGLVSIDAGSVYWQGQRVVASDKQRFGYLPEERGLYPTMKVMDQLVYLGQLHGMTMRKAIKEVNMWIERLGLTDQAQDKVQTLSLGNQQRVQLIATLLHKPDLLVLDEPFSGLDPVAVDLLSGILKEQALRGAAVLFSSHQLDLVQDLCEQIIIINKGKVVMEGDLETLRLKGSLQIVAGIQGKSAKEWAGSLVNGKTVTFDGQEATIEPKNIDSSGALLSEIMKHGQLQTFYARKRPLSELFREAVRS